MCNTDEQQGMVERLNSMNRRIETESSSRPPPGLEKSSQLDEGCMCIAQCAPSEGHRVLGEPPAAPQPRALWDVRSDESFRAEPPIERRTSGSLSSAEQTPPTLATLRLKKRAEQNQLIVEARASWKHRLHRSLDLSG